jgi:CheY-like chemotaxis protein
MPHRILVVDDHPLQRRVLAQQLEALGHRAVFADDADEAVLLWSAGRFDLALLASHLFDNASLARRLRAHDTALARRAAPIVAYGNTVAEGPRGTAVQAHWPMPMMLDALAIALRKVLHDDDLPPPDPARWSLFEHTSRADLAAARAALAGDDAAGLRASLHRIKGAAQMLRRDAIAAACLAAEAAVHAVDAATMSMLVDAIEASLDADALPQGNR